MAARQSTSARGRVDQQEESQLSGCRGRPLLPRQDRVPVQHVMRMGQRHRGRRRVSRAHMCTQGPRAGERPRLGDDRPPYLRNCLAAGGGIGGGGLLVPIYRLVAGFPITQATALSLATISGGSIANLYTYTRRYHPNETLKRPLIDYEASLLFCPALLAGTMFGSVFSVMFPPWLTVILLVALLGYSGKRTLNKGIKRWKGEDKQSPRPTLEEAGLADVEIDTPLGHADAPPIAREDPCGSRPRSRRRRGGRLDLRFDFAQARSPQLTRWRASKPSTPRRARWYKKRTGRPPAWSGSSCLFLRCYEVVGEARR